MILSPEEQASLARVVRWALVLRIGAAVALHFAGAEALFAPDQQTYDVFSSWLARYWSGDTLTYPWKLREPGPKAYYYIVAALYFVLDHWSLAPKLVNAVVGTATVRLVFSVALKMTDSASIALRAAAYTAFFPSLVLWSALNIRDCWVVLLIVLICRQALALQERVNLWSLAVLLASVLAVVQFRDYIFFAVTGPAVISFLVRNRANVARNVLVGMILASVVIYADRAAGSGRLRSIDLEALQEIRQGTAVGGSRFAPSADISTPGKALAFLPQGLAFFLLAPFPWTIANVRQAFTLPEMLFFYSLLPAIVRGIAALVRHRLSSALMVLLITAGLTFGYALGEANAGTAYRHRAQVLVFYLVFAAVGVEQRRQRGGALDREASPQPAPASVAS